MSKIIFIFSISLAILFSGCGDKKEASKDNFKKVINNYYDKNDDTCPTLPISFGNIIYNSAFSHQFPTKLFKNDPYKERIDILVDIGLLTKKETKVKEIMSEEIRDGFEYNLTDLGTKFYKNKSFCVGKYKVTEITQFTPPTNFGPITGSQVSFKKVTFDIPNWALELAKKEPYNSNKEFKNLITGEEIKESTILALTNDGWITYMEYQKNMK